VRASNNIKPESGTIMACKPMEKKRDRSQLKGTKSGKPNVSTSQASAAKLRKLFAEAYLSNGHNATAAAVTAGYSATRPDEAGRRLLLRPDVQAIIAERAKAVSDLTEMTTETWARELRAIAFSTIGDLFGPDGKLRPLRDLPAHTLAAISSIKVHPSGAVEYKLWNKNQALETVARHLGLFSRDNEQLQSNIRVEVILMG
jgi:phage terminase small subunit